MLLGNLTRRGVAFTFMLERLELLKVYVSKFLLIIVEAPIRIITLDKKIP